MSVSEMGRSFYIQTKETEDQTMATKKTAVIPEEEILAAATEENINEHALHQTETEPEPDRVLSAEGAPGDADLIDICPFAFRSLLRYSYTPPAPDNASHGRTPGDVRKAACCKSRNTLYLNIRFMARCYNNLSKLGNRQRKDRLGL